MSLRDSAVLVSIDRLGAVLPDAGVVWPCETEPTDERSAPPSLRRADLVRWSTIVHHPPPLR
ncbi:hypothetical protein NITMOv2_1482 [Nitrospira moscoviensis]|uniref:Uncharacterized protein n=1 Tax=Nitrospira moscoviensis TaxID=42253 RepID=A0A0K2GAM9_NITMO|nr:hypothetical protein NITMOv2_1482 [Nitrospira moscoviensis]